jgi:hypothetical protein
MSNVIFIARQHIDPQYQSQVCAGRSNRHPRPEFSPPHAAGTEPLGEAWPPLTDEQYLAKLVLFNHYIVVIPFFCKCGDL